MDKYTKFALQIAKKAATRLMRDFKKFDPSTRGTPKEIKTRYDEIIDKMLIKEIEKEYPDHSILTEESGWLYEGDDFLWIIDPLDGTGNYMNGNPFFAISIALWIKGKPHCGVIEAPAIGETFVSQKGQGAYFYNNGRKSKATLSKTKDIKKAYLTYCEGGSKEKHRVLNYVNQFYDQSKDMRKLGSAALECAWVGIGRTDAYITPSISLWDIAAGMIFVKEAGGRNLDFNLKPLTPKNLIENWEAIHLVAANKALKLNQIKY
jgi:myo-inositol-1(or 4)-monophosphatase